MPVTMNPHTERKPARRRLGPIMAVGVLSLALAGWVWAQPAQTAPTGEQVSAGGPAFPKATRVPKDVLENRPRRVVVLPSQPGEAGEPRSQLSGGTQENLDPEAPLLPEGYVVAMREARVIKGDRWWLVDLAEVEGMPAAPPLRVLPNQRLAMLEAVVAHAQVPPPFLVTGRVTEFLGSNYLLIENLEEVAPPPAPIVEPPDAEPADESPATTQPAGAEPTAEEVMQQLLQHKKVRPVVLPDSVPVVGEATEKKTESPEEGDGAERDAAEETSPAPSGDANRDQPAWPEESLLVDRAGRIIAGDKWWTFVFEDLGKHPNRKPIRLLPNRLLENAIALSGGGTEGTVFIVSGELTLHNEVNYLLLRKLLVRRDLGNFR